MNGCDLGVLDEVAEGEIAKAASGGPFRESFPDFSMEIVDLIAEDDKVVAHFLCSGTHEGEWQGRLATGKRFDRVDEIFIFDVWMGSSPTSPLSRTT